MRKTNPILLCIETSTHLCSVAITEGDQVVFKKEQSDEKYLHAELLHAFIDEVLKHADDANKKPDAIVVGLGPGSYTGLRIGVSAAKGLAYSMDLPIIGVNSLLSIAQSAQQNLEQKIFTAPMIDARRNEVYTLLLDNEGSVAQPTDAVVLTEAFLNDIDAPILIVGDAARKAEIILGNERFAYNFDIDHSAENMCLIAQEKYGREAFEDLAYFEPFYLKSFIANKPKNQFKKA